MAKMKLRLALVLGMLMSLVAGALAQKQSLGIDALAQKQGREATPAVVNPVMRSKLSTWLSLDGSWEFRVDPEMAGYEGRWYETGSWPGAERQIEVPGAWEAQGVGEPGRSNVGTAGHETYGHKMFTIYGGAAWYRRTIEIPAKWSGRRIWLKIGGINCIGWIWLNDTYLARHYEYAGTYKYDISNLVTAGKPATVTVLVRNDIPSRQGEVNSLRTFGGLHRSVELEATPPVFVDYAYVEGDLDVRSASVHVTLRSTAKAAQEVDVKVSLATLDGQPAGKAGRKVTIKAGQTVEVVLEIPLNPFRAWSPEHPNLYRAEVVIEQDDKPVHGWVERFGVKKFEAREKRLWLNNRLYFLRGYGDDHAYPLTVCSPADREVHRGNLSRAKAYGFNFVRHHTHVEVPEYFEAADELGIMVQSELPYWAHGSPEDDSYPHVSHMSGGPKDPPGDLRTLIKHFRRYVSLSIYCGGNEGHYQEAVGKELHDLAKTLDPSRPWMGQERDTNMGASASDLQSFSRAGSGDAFAVPLLDDENDCPMIQHEYLSFSTGDDPRLEPRYRDGYAPNWTMAEAREAAQKAGLEWAQTEACIEAGYRLQGIFHKIGIESSRLCPRIDGYSMWLLIDFPPATWNGLLNVFHGRKHSTPEYFTTFNQPVVVLARNPDPQPGVFMTGFPAAAEYVLGRDRAQKHFMTNQRFLRPMLNAFHDWPIYTSGETVDVNWVLSNFGEKPITGAKLTWRLRGAGKVLTRGEANDVTVAVGDVAEAGKAGIQFPEVTQPLKTTVEVAVEPGGWTNSWDVWVFPKLAGRASLGRPVAVSGRLYDLLAKRYRDVVRLGDPGSEEAKVLITDEGGSQTVEALETGKRVLCLSLPQTQAIKIPTRLGNWGWREQAGTVLAAGHKAFGRFPNDGYMNQPWFRVMHQAVKLTPNGLAGGADPLMFGWGSGGYFACVFEAKAGKGAVLVSGLDLTEKTRDFPESAYLLDQMIRYVASDDFVPKGKVDPTLFLRWVNPTRILEKLNGFAEITHDTEAQDYHSGVFGLLPSHFVRQTDGKAMLTWRTKPLAKEDIPAGGEAVFRWPATTGWFTEPAGGHFALFLNGKALLNFDVTPETKRWQTPDNSIALTYNVMGFTRPDKMDSVGIMTLTVPAGMVKIGESVEIGVKGSASGSKRFFMLYETR